MLSLLFVMQGSKNFTSSLAVQMLPSVPIDHCVRNEANETFLCEKLVFKASLNTHGLTPCFVILCWEKFEHIFLFEKCLPALSTLILSK